MKEYTKSLAVTGSPLLNLSPVFSLHVYSVGLVNEQLCAASGWGVFKELSWWEPVAVASSVVGLIAVVPYVVGLIQIKRLELVATKARSEASGKTPESLTRSG